MIILPTKRKLIRRRDLLYQRLQSILHFCSIGQVEDIMRKIHHINNRLRSYKDNAREPQEIFKDEDDDITT